MILTLNRIKALDSFLSRIIDALANFVRWLRDNHDTAITYLGYKAIRSAAMAVQKADNEVMDLEDARAEMGADYIDALADLKAKHRAAEQALADAYHAKVDAIHGKMADASLRVLILEDRYEEVLASVRDELGVEVND